MSKEKQSAQNAMISCVIEFATALSPVIENCLAGFDKTAAMIGKESFFQTLKETHKHIQYRSLFHSTEDTEAAFDQLYEFTIEIQSRMRFYLDGIIAAWTRRAIPKEILIEANSMEKLRTAIRALEQVKKPRHHKRRKHRHEKGLDSKTRRLLFPSPVGIDGTTYGETDD